MTEYFSYLLCLNFQIDNTIIIINLCIFLFKQHHHHYIIFRFLRYTIHFKHHTYHIKNGNHVICIFINFNFKRLSSHFNLSLSLKQIHHRLNLEPKFNLILIIQI